MKNKFYKNLFQTLSCFASIILLDIILLIAYGEAVKYGSAFAWVLLVIIFGLIVLFFSVGFFWIFQKVIIDEQGVRITFISKTISSCKWDEIERIEEANIMKNPAIRIKIIGGKEIHLDKRKKIIDIIHKYSNKI